MLEVDDGHDSAERIHVGAAFLSSVIKMAATRMDGIFGTHRAELVVARTDPICRAGNRLGLAATLFFLPEAGGASRGSLIRCRPGPAGFTPFRQSGRQWNRPTSLPALPPPNNQESSPSMIEVVMRKTPGPECARAQAHLLLGLVPVVDLDEQTVVDAGYLPDVNAVQLRASL
jgi:hypothetical protein